MEGFVGAEIESSAPECVCTDCGRRGRVTLETGGRIGSAV
jgi:hypothetical protein